jgi:hypothetical protein
VVEDEAVELSAAEAESIESGADVEAEEEPLE